MFRNILLSTFMFLLLSACDEEKPLSPMQQRSKDVMDAYVANELKSASIGDVLVSNPKMTNPEFAHSVILLIKKSKGKVAGVMLNKLSNDRITSYYEGLKNNRVKIFHGGPMNKDQLYIIHTHGNEIKNSDIIREGLFLMGDSEATKSELNKTSNPSAEFKFFTGVCNWQEGQLEAELKNNEWSVMSFGASQYMTDASTNLWEKLTQATKSE